MKEKNTEVYNGKTLGDLLEEVHTNSSTKRKEIFDMIKVYSSMVTTPNDVITIGPVINNLIDISIKNDEHVAKVATIAQRIIAASYRSAGEGGGEFMLSDDERERLLMEAHQDLEETIEEVDEMEEELERLRNESDKGDGKVDEKEV